jgi:hypothetical protein
MRLTLLGLVLTLALGGPALARPGALGAPVRDEDRPSQSDPLARAVQAYAGFETDLSAVSAAQVSSADALDQVLLAVARHDPAALSRGWRAYAALTAAQAPAFVHGLQLRVRAAGRGAVLRQLIRDPTYARRRPAGASDAIALMLTTMSADAARLAVAADRYDGFADQWRQTAPFGALDDSRRQARDQRLHAAQAPPLAPDIAARLQIAPLAASPAADPAGPGGAHFWDDLAGLPSTLAAPMHPRADRSALIDRALTLAGIAAIAAAPQPTARIEALLDDPASRACLEVQQLEFRQCISVSHGADEDAACLGRHGLRNVETCLTF